MQKEQIKTKTARKAIWQQAEVLGLPAAMWRLPNEKTVHLIVSEHEEPQLNEFEAFKNASGFAFGKFLNSNQNLLIPADFYVAFNENNEELNTLGHTLRLGKSIENLFALTPTRSHKKADKKQDTKLYDAPKFEAMVREAIEAIKAGQMQKVVLSRTKEVILKENFELMVAFDELCKFYPTAFISMVSVPSLGQVWMGASPETLVSQNANGIFKTMALAGTQSALDAAGNQIETHEAMWRQKEIEEQAYVSRYIIDCFKKIRLREFDEEGPKTVIAGNLMHLKTDFWVDVEHVAMPELLEVMLRLLHPTSAVCGMPKEPATAFIQAVEHHDREFYSGFLGPVNIGSATHLFVNLRTMKIEGNLATLFAGCGITEYSSPAKEWLETEMKCQTMMRVV